MDWFKSLKNVLRVEKIAYVLNRPLPKSPPTNASDSDKSAYHKHIVDSEIASRIMLASRTTKLQMQHEAMESNYIVIHLRELFDRYARTEMFEISKLLFSTKTQVGTPMQHVLLINTYIERLGKLGFVMDHELSINLILSSLTDNFVHFVLNFQMESKETSILELMNLFKTVEPTLKKEAKTVMLVDSSTSKKSYKNKKKKKKPMKVKEGITKKKVKKVAPKGTCFHYGQNGH